MRKNKGVALVSVIIMFVVSFILLASMTLILRQDLNETRNQDARTEAYYLALSGIEIGYAALLSDTNTDVNIEELYYKEFKGTNKEQENKNIAFGNGEIDIKLKGIKSADGKDWIVINSTGRLNKTGITVSTNMEFMADNPAIIKRYKE